METDKIKVEKVAGCKNPTCCPCNSPPGNPGTFDEFHKKVDDLYLNNFEGLKMIIKNHLSKHFDTSHAIVMSSFAPSGYAFAANYVGTKRIGFYERYPRLYGEIKPNGNLTANIIQTIGCRCRMKMSTYIENGKYKSFQTTTDYRTDDSTYSISFIDPVILKGEGTVLVRYLQALSPRLTLGAEVAYCKSHKAPKGASTNIAGAFRWSTGIQTLSATAGPAGVRVCYHKRLSHQLQIGVELLSKFYFRNTQAAILYRVDLPFADLVFKGFVNSQMSIGAILEKKLYPIPEATLILSAFVNHNKQSVKVGIGVNIDK